MGVLTTAYAVTSGTFDTLRQTDDNLDVIFYPEEKPPDALGLPKDWAPIQFAFDKSWDDLLRILKQCGFKTVYTMLDSRPRPLAYKYSDFWVRYLAPTAIRTLSEKLEKASVERMKECGLKKGLKDTDSFVMNEDDYDYVLGDVEQMKDFFREAAHAEQYVILVSV